MRTIRELAKEAIEVQNASNLSGCVHSFSKAITELRDIANAEGWASTEKINAHPITIVWTGKIADLSGLTLDKDGTDKFLKSLSHLEDIH
jgi:hypothetical protein